MARSSKNKGVAGQNEVRDILRQKYPMLDADDITCRGMGQTGTDIILSPVAKTVIPFEIEVKRQERLNIYKAIEQAEQNSDDKVPIVAFRKNFMRWYAAIPLQSLLSLIENEQSNKKNELKEKIKKLVDTL